MPFFEHVCRSSWALRSSHMGSIKRLWVLPWAPSESLHIILTGQTYAILLPESTGRGTQAVDSCRPAQAAFGTLRRRFCQNTCQLPLIRYEFKKYRTNTPHFRKYPIVRRIKNTVCKRLYAVVTSLSPRKIACQMSTADASGCPFHKKDVKLSASANRRPLKGAYISGRLFCNALLGA